MKKVTSDSVAASAVTVALEYMAHTATTRAAFQAEKGVGLNAGATYVSRYVEKGALKASAEAVAGGKLKWAKEEVALVMTGNKGTAVRFGRVSECGGFVEAIGTTGAKGVLSVGIFGEKGKLEILTQAELAKRAQDGKAFTFTRTEKDAQGAVRSFTGRIIRNSLDAKIVALVYAIKGGRVFSVDIETDKHNAHNAQMRGFVAGAEADSLAITDGAIKAVIGGTRNRKGERTGKKAAAKKKTTS